MSINVANNNPHVVYTVAEGATQTTFSITFEFFDDDEVQLYVDGIIKTQGSGDGNYTITGGEGSTGTATFNTVSSGIQPVTGITGGSQVVIARNIPIERVTDFSAGSDINRAALNTQLDTLTAIAADNKMRSVRALTAPITDPTDVGTSLVIPKAADRANGFLSFDSNGNAAINSVVDLSFLTLERLDIDNVRIDGNTVSSTTGSLILAPTADVEINIPASSSLYMQRAGTTALDFAFTSISQEVRFINTTTATTYSVIQSNHLGGTSSDLILKSDGGPLELDTGGGTIPLKDDGVQRGYLNINTANTIKLYTGTGTGTLNTTFDGADVTIAGELVVSGNLTVDGTTTTINSTTLTVDDKNIVLASGAASSLAADGAGITIDGASATLTYVHLTGAMTFNKDVDIGDNDIENAQKLHFTENVSLYPSDGDDSILNLQAEDTGSAQLRFITGTGSGVFRGGIVASQNNVFGLKDSNDQTFIKSQEGNLPTQIFHTYDSPSAGSYVRIEAGSNFVKLYGSEGVEAQKYKDADDTSYYLEPAGTSVLATVGATELNVDNITIDGNTISSTDTDGNINLRCNGDGVVDVDSELFVYGNAINGTSAYVQIGNTDTGGDDVRIQGPNPNFSLYDSTAVADGVAAYTGGVNFYGQKTNTAYHKYSTIRPRIINGLDSDTARTGALHFGVSDGASAAATNIIFKIEPDGIEVAGNIISTNDPLKISATTASASANIILEGDSSPFVAIRGDGSNTDRLLLRYDDSNDFSYISASGNLSIGATNTGHTLSLTSNDGMFITNSSSNMTITSSSSDIIFKTGTSGSTTERMRIAGAGGISVSADMSFGDNDKAIFGAGSDLQIYHDGYGSFVDDQGTGGLILRGTNLFLRSSANENYLGAVADGSVTIYHDNAPKLETTSTGVDITGTLTVNNFASLSNTTLTIGGEGGANGVINSDESIYLNIDSNNNETGKVFRVGTDSTSTGGKSIALFSDNGDISFYEDTGTTAKFFWDASAESLGIGTSSPAGALHIHGGSYGEQFITSSNSAMRFVSTGGVNYIQSGTATSSSSAADLIFTNVGGSDETMRLDASGNLLVGKTSASTSTVGGEINPDGTLVGVRDGGNPLFLNRLTSDGAIATFRKDGAPVGSIGTQGGDLIIDSSSSNHSGLRFSSPAILPRYNGALADNQVDLGQTSSNYRFKDLYLSGSIEIENGTGNVGVGKQALNSNTANYNTAVGYQAGYSNTTNASSSFFGHTAGYSTTGTRNTFLGQGSGYWVSSGAKNTILGPFDGNQGGLDIRTSSNNIVLSDGDGNPRLHIDSSGRILAATTSNIASSNAVLHIDADGVATGAGSIISECAATTTVYHVHFRNGNGGVGGISTNGSSTSYVTSSDHRLKENVVDLTGATTRLKQLEPKRFNFIADADTTVDGFLAHEVQSVVPEAITGTHNEVDADSNPVYQGIDQSKLVPLLVATIKELEARITALEDA